MNVMGDEGIHPRARRRSPTRLFFEGKDERQPPEDETTTVISPFPLC
jgi:hypothetical protein